MGVVLRAFLIVLAGCANVFGLDHVDLAEPPLVRCEIDEQCVRGTETGRCECGACSFLDTACPLTNRRWPASAPVALANRCVNAPVQVDSTVFHTCMLLSDGSPWCWGMNAGGQLGPGQAAGVGATVPVPVVDSAGILLDLESIETGAFHTCAITAERTVACWGSNEVGQLGAGLVTGPDMRSLEPVLVTTDTGVLDNVTRLSSGYFSTCARRGNDSVYCWGSNSRGQLARAPSPFSSIAVAVSLKPGTIEDVSVGGEHACAVVKPTGGVAETYCWGRGANGRLGNNMDLDSSVPVRVAQAAANVPLANAVTVDASNRHSCVRTFAPTGFRCWGANAFSELGIAASGESWFAAPVVLQTTAENLLIAAGDHHTCALHGVDTLCWGADDQGQVGDGPVSTQNKLVPTVVIASNMQRDLTAGHNHTCAIGADTRLRCWGGNSDGQLGLGDLVARSEPTEIPASAVCPR